MHKPVKYAPIPDFDQSTQYVVQKEPVDMGDYIFCDVEIRQLEIDETEGMNGGV